MDFNHHTGLLIDGWEEVIQSLATILSTRINTRMFFREFGSKAPEMVDMPMTDANILALYVAVAEAIDKWEPRFVLIDVALNANADGQIVMQLSGNYVPRAHLGDGSIVNDEAQVIQLMADGRVENWSVAA